MRLVYWTEYFWPSPGGTETLAGYLCPAFKAAGHELLIVTSSLPTRRGELDSFASIEMLRLPFRDVLESRDPRRILALKERLRTRVGEFAPDLIHFHSIGSGDFFLRMLPYPYCVSVHQVLDPETFPKSGRETLLGARGVIACSKFALNELQAIDCGQKARLIYHGLPTPQVRPKELPWPARLLVLGRMLPFKGFDLALQAYAQVLRYFPDVRLTMVGDGPERESLQAMGAQLGLSVEFPGWIASKDVADCLNEFTMVVVPSRWEGFGLVALEAMQMARPVVACRNGGLVEVIEHEVSGLLTEPNSEALGEAIIRLLSNPTWATDLGQRGRLETAQKFSLERCVREHQEFYSQCLQA